MPQSGDGLSSPAMSPTSHASPPDLSATLPSFSSHAIYETNLLRKCATAAEARAAANRDDPDPPENHVTASERLDFFRCLDSDLFPPLASPAERAKAINSISILLLLLDNALAKGLHGQGNTKFLQFSLSNPLLRAKLNLDGREST